MIEERRRQTISPCPRALSWGLALATLSGCVSPDTRPLIEGEVGLATHQIHRGMVQNERGVARGNVTTTIPLTFQGSDQGDLRFDVRGYINLQDDTGDAWLADGHGGEFGELDLSLEYFRPVGPVDLTAGITQYVLPNGEELDEDILLLRDERGTTTEIFTNVAVPVLPTTPLSFTPSLRVHYDIDEAEGFYIRAGIDKSITLRRFVITASIGLGYSEDKHSDWTYGTLSSDEDDGFADLEGTLRVDYDINETYSVFAGIGAVTLLDTDIRDWIDDRSEIDTESIWGFAGLSFRI